MYYCTRKNTKNRTRKGKPYYYLIMIMIRVKIIITNFVCSYNNIYGRNRVSLCVSVIGARDVVGM